MADYLLVTTVRSGDPSFQTLAELAGRVAALLQFQRVRDCGSLAACLDDLLGAIYSLMYARHYKYEDRPHELGQADVENVLARAKDMAGLRIRTEGKWTAGFYFNNALFRLAAVYHRVLKTLVGKEGAKFKVPELEPQAKAKYRALRNTEWVNDNLKAIHKEVNDLKHRPGGVSGGRNVLFDSAFKAVDEMLILIETLK